MKQVHNHKWRKQKGSKELSYILRNGFTRGYNCVGAVAALELCEITGPLVSTVAELGDGTS